MSEPTRFDAEADQDDFARGQREDPPVTVEEELELEREGTFAEGQEELPHDTIEKDRTDSFARGQEEQPEDTLEKVHEGTFAEGQEQLPNEPERIEPSQPLPGNVPPDEEPDPIR